MKYSQARGAMRGVVLKERHGVARGRQIKNLEQPWKKCCRKQGVRGDREREPCIRNQGRVDMHIGYSG